MHFCIRSNGVPLIMIRCGKTYTMEGDFTQVKQRGIIPRSVEKIFHELKMNQDLKNELYVTFQEVFPFNLGL